MEISAPDLEDNHHPGMDAMIAATYPIDPPFNIPSSIWADYMQRVRANSALPELALEEEARRGLIAEWLERNEIKVATLISSIAHNSESQNQG